MSISDEAFDALISRALASLPSAHMAALDNVAITYADEPTADQRAQLALRGDQTLLGLFEGVSRVAQLGMTNSPPSRITLFKLPLLASVETEAALYEAVRHTLWHELAHYFGLDHDDIARLE